MNSLNFKLRSSGIQDPQARLPQRISMTYHGVHGKVFVLRLQLHSVLVAHADLCVALKKQFLIVTDPVKHLQRDENRRSLHIILPHSFMKFRYHHSWGFVINLTTCIINQTHARLRKDNRMTNVKILTILFQQTIRNPFR